MSLSSIFSIGFKNYLSELNNISDKKYQLDESDISLFLKYQTEAKSYLTDELNVDPKIISEDLTSILEMAIKDGQIINPNDKDIEDTLKEYGENPTIKMGEESVTQMLNDLFQDSSLQKTIDADGNGELSSEEIETFINAIKGYDGDGENVSLEDILGAMQAINDETFSLDPEAAQKVEDEVKTAKTHSSRGSGASGGIGGGGGGVSGGTQGVQEKTLDNMSKDELNSELSKSQDQLEEKKNNLSGILSGSDPALESLKKAEDDAYKTYQEELEKVDEDMAEELDNIKTDIEAKEKEISEKEQEISDQENTVSDCETSYNNAVTTTKTLETCLSSLKSTDTSDMDEDKKSEISNKIAELETKINQAKENEEKAKTEWDKAKEELSKLEDEKEDLISGEGGLNELNESKDELEAEIQEKYPEIKEYMDAYNDAKNEYITTKETMTTEAKAEVQEAQEYVNEVNSAINNYDNKQTAKEYSFSTLGENIMDFAKQFIGANEADGSANKFLGGGSAAATPWCAAFVEYIMENSGNYEDVPDWYKNIDNKWYCPNVYQAASAAGAVINGQEVQQGDIVLFDWNNDGVKDHIGIVDVNDGNTIVTIEGNTSNSVAQRSYDINDSRLTFCRVVS